MDKPLAGGLEQETYRYRNHDLHTFRTLKDLGSRPNCTSRLYHPLPGQPASPSGLGILSEQASKRKLVIDSKSDSSGGVGTNKWTFFAMEGTGMVLDVLASLGPHFNISHVIKSSCLGGATLWLRPVRALIPPRGMFRQVEIGLFTSSTEFAR